MNPRRLYRCRHDRVLAGVASGMAEYLELDPTVVRILWILSAVLGGFTILLYIILAFVMPIEPLAVEPPSGVAPLPGVAPEGGDAGNAGADTTAVPAYGWASAGTPASGWSTPAPHHIHRQGDGRGGLFLGVLLVVLGGIAMINVALPGWVAVGLIGPGFLVALGLAFVVVAVSRRTAPTR